MVMNHYVDDEKTGRMVYEPKYLRFFQARFEPVPRGKGAPSNRTS